MSGLIGYSELVFELNRLLDSLQISRWIAEEVSSKFDEHVFEKAIEYAERYMAGEPLQYIFGHWSFRSLELLCDRRALIPRPETEQLVDLVKSEIAGTAGNKTVLDLGTGTGAIALSLALELDDVDVVATDNSCEALQLAQENIDLFGALRGRVNLICSDLFQSIPQSLRFDYIVSNPPYVPSGTHLEDMVIKHEPLQAIFAGKDGFMIVDQIISQAPKWLNGQSGMVFLEIDETHGVLVKNSASRSGYSECNVIRDLAGRERFAHLIL